MPSGSANAAEGGTATVVCVQHRRVARRTCVVRVVRVLTCVCVCVASYVCMLAWPKPSFFYAGATVSGHKRAPLARNNQKMKTHTNDINICLILWSSSARNDMVVSLFLRPAARFSHFLRHAAHGRSQCSLSLTVLPCEGKADRPSKTASMRPNATRMC